MNRKLLVILAVIGLLILIVGVIFVFRGRQTPSPETPPPEVVKTEEITKDTSQETFTISRLPNNWQLIENLQLNYALEIPPAWQAKVLGDDLEANFWAEGFRATVRVSTYQNLKNISLEEWVGKELFKKSQRIFKNGREGVSYVTQELAEAYDEKGNPQLVPVNNSYFLNNTFRVNQKIISVGCGVRGENYKTMISTCHGIIGSFKFLQ